MTLVMTTAPAVEPIAITDAKTQLRIDDTSEDTLIASLILTSRLHIETALGLALITQGWSYFLDRWPAAGEIPLPMRPIAAITAVRLYDEAGHYTTLAPSAYQLDASALAPRLVRPATATWSPPTRTCNGIEIAFTAGFGSAPTDIPEPIRHAVRLLTAHWYEHRAPVEFGQSHATIPTMISDLLAPYRQVRL